ncbi:MoxR family ATPase [soil metagenome]
MEEQVFQNRVDLSGLQTAIGNIKKEINKIIVGQDDMIELLIAAILADGHVLIEGVPGVAKTLSAKLLSRTMTVDFSRIQFTPDLMPSDIIGTSIYNLKTSDFEFKKGPLFSNIVLIDEINRAPAKTQSALFEAMEERQITVDGKTYQLSPPFIVLATQNPVEQEGTYRLPEAQLDRFLFKIEVEYPTLEDETRIVAEYHARKNTVDINSVNGVMNAAEVKEYREKVSMVHIDGNLISYIAKIVNQTRNNSSLYLGASPRASLAILTSSKAIAAMRGRDFVTPDDIKFVATPVLKHRVILTPEKEMEGTTTKEVIKQIIEKIEVPR